jgi:ribosomal protein L21E
MKTIKFLLLIIFFSLRLFADVNLHSSNTFIKGEPFIFEFEAKGNNVKFPKIEKIDNLVVESLGSSKSIEIINGNYSEKITKRYRVIPENNFTIPNFTFIVDGKKIETPAKMIVETKVSKTLSNDFDLTLVTSKKSLYVGEDLLVKLIFKYKKGLQITDSALENPHFDNFWYKRIKNPNNRYEENGYIVEELKFLLFPQKSGKLKVGPLNVRVQTIDTHNGFNTFGFFSSVPKRKKIYSNSLEFDVKPLPSGVSLIGDFNISAKIDKNSVNQGEAISYKLQISGEGNFDDINDIKLSVPDATIYDNKPEVKTQYTQSANKGTYTKSYSILPNSSTTIPSISIKYFDKKTQEVITKKTKAFKIEVKNLVEKKVVLQKAESVKTTKIEKKVVEKSSTTDKIIYALLGAFITLLILGLYKVVKISSEKKNKNDTPLINKVKKIKFREDLLKLLVPYLKKDESLDELIFKCEKDIDIKELKKEIIKLLKELKI